MAFKVLIVEDSRATREFLAAAVEVVSEVEVFQSPSGFDALKLLPRHRFDLIITDINMPDINGLELVRFIRESAQHKATPLIIISTDGREADRDRGMKLGADAYLTKPFAPETLIETVRSVLKA
jgi:two-component system chemotaxis response regulator CheY